MEKIWVKITKFTDYEISESGDIRSNDREKHYRSGRIMRFRGKTINTRKHPLNGFLFTDLIDDRGMRKTVYIHKLVATMFIPNDKPRIKKIVVHLDKNTENNHFTNLSWISNSDNVRNSFKTGRRSNADLWEKRRVKYGPSGIKISPSV